MAAVAPKATVFPDTNVISPTKILHIAFVLCTLGGVALVFLPQGSFDWWNPLWVLLAAAAAYASLAAGIGLAAARVTAAAVLAGFAAVLLVAHWAAVTPVFFTAHVGPRLGGALPVLPVVLGFALLVFAQRAAARVFPSAGRWAVNGLAALGFLITLANATAFLGGVRLWWLWNPLGELIPWWVAPATLAVAGLCAMALAWAIPAPVKLQRHQPDVWLLAAVNALFLVATVKDLA